MEDPRFMRRCLDLARKGRGKVGNGALVGAVLVRDGKVIAEAFHEGFGCPHAERKLLESYQGAIEPNDVLYVNLEPCSHTGKTPPCTNILIERGVKNVIYGMSDPDQRNNGKSVELLRSKEVSIKLSSVRAECELLNKGFALLRTHNRPWITMKSAKDLHGKTCNDDGTPKKITSPQQNIWSHTFLRCEHDAIAVGIGTVLSDDPKLDTRLAQGFSVETGLIAKKECEMYQPYRVIFDADFQIPLSAKVLTDERPTRTIVCVSQKAFENDAAKRNELHARGVLLFDIETDGRGFDWNDLWKTLTIPVDGFHGITSILLEGGAKTWKIFREAGMLDEEVKLIGV